MQYNLLEPRKHIYNATMSYHQFQIFLEDWNSGVTNRNQYRNIRNNQSIYNAEYINSL